MIVEVKVTLVYLISVKTGCIVVLSVELTVLTQPCRPRFSYLLYVAVAIAVLYTCSVRCCMAIKVN